MVDWRLKIITAEAERLIELAEGDAELRRDLRSLAQTILAATADPQNGDALAGPNPAPADRADPAQPVGQRRPDPARPMADPPREPLRALTLGRPSPTQRGGKLKDGSPARPGSRPPDDELAELEARCRAKAGAARWAVAGVIRLPGDSDPEPDDVPSDAALVDWADRIAGCYLWQIASEESQPVEISALDDLAGCLDALADGLALVRATQGNPKLLEQVLPMVAEAQSALRGALRQIQASDDPDQLQVFEWLKSTTARHRVYLQRFMRADDLASPGGWRDLRARIGKVQERHASKGGRSRHEALLARLRSRLEGIRRDRSTEAEWRDVVQAVEDVVSGGVPPSNRELRELLLPILDEVPDLGEIPPGLRLVLREIERFQAGHEQPPTIESAGLPAPTAGVTEAARLLAGRSLVLIGGDRRREAQEALERALGLNELVWIETKEHQAIDAFEPVIARPDVAAVLLAIRWSSHSFGEVKQLCDRRGKPLVRLPGGYNPNQVAAQILAQSSGHLARD